MSLEFLFSVYWNTLVYFGESESGFVIDDIYFESLLFSLNWNQKCNVGRDAYDILWFYRSKITRTGAVVYSHSLYLSTLQQLISTRSVTMTYLLYVVKRILRTSRAITATFYRDKGRKSVQ